MSYNMYDFIRILKEIGGFITLMVLWGIIWIITP